ncbi:hypothetical protein BKA04_001872 [Cryobacterium mesophilum]|uniref:hypothetical protein n=1 Tax=Terrimesophilobacter mesophilus TaxID=433647 RepID=UPI00157F8E49|nr:hypothetical protein [Terrimesophilobacter mesophilus]MBB5633649.1 hypothetical protein [Terrimesophilobacter mesophilus]
MTTRRLAPVFAFAAFALLLSGCTFTANLTVPPESVATVAEDALEAEVGSRPAIDCGDEDVDLVNGTEVACVLTDPATSIEYDAKVVIDDVEGTKYQVNVTVADEPRAGSVPAPDVEEPAAEGIRHSIAAASVSKLAADALFKEAPPYFEVDCGDSDLDVFLGAVFDCSATHPEGAVYDAAITVTDVTETTYKIDVVRAAAPRS